MSHTLYGVFGNFRTTIVAVACELSKLDWKPEFKTWAEVKSDEFKKIVPL
jgi:hypothetical protein